LLLFMQIKYAKLTELMKDGRDHFAFSPFRL